MIGRPAIEMRALLFLVVAAAAGQAAAEGYPAKPVRIITGAAGIFHDIATRQLGQRLSAGSGAAPLQDDSV